MEPQTSWGTSIPNRLEALVRAMDELDGCLVRWGADEGARYLARLAVEELGTNTLKYGYDDRLEHCLRLDATSVDGRVRIQIEDDGHAFDPWQRPEPDPNLSLQERTPGGWGISLLRRLLTSVGYERRGDRNIVSVTFPLRSEPG